MHRIFTSGLRLDVGLNLVLLLLAQTNCRQQRIRVSIPHPGKASFSSPYFPSPFSLLCAFYSDRWDIPVWWPIIIFPLCRLSLDFFSTFFFKGDLVAKKNTDFLHLVYSGWWLSPSFSRIRYVLTVFLAELFQWSIKVFLPRATTEVKLRLPHYLWCKLGLCYKVTLLCMV